MEGGGGRERKSGPLVLNWDKLLTDDPPQEVIIEEAAAAKSKSPVGVMAENSEEVSQAEQCYREISEKDLAEKINRAHGMFKMKLPDGGEKLRANLKKLQAEQERRMRMKDANKDKTVIPLDDESTDNGATDALSARRAPPSAPASEFALRFCSNLNDGKATKCFGEELSTLNCSGGHNNMRECVPFSAQRRDISSRQTSFKSPRHLSVDIDNVPQSDEQQCGSHSSNMCADQSDKNVPSCSIKKKKESAARGESPLTSRRSNVRRRCRSPLSTIRNKVFPNTDLKPEPHINSRITVWKRNYHSLFEILKNTGVGLDSTTKMIEATDEQWDAFMKVDPNAQLMRSKSWPLYDDWCEIFGNSRATGEASVSHLRATTPPPLFSTGMNVDSASNRVGDETQDESQSPSGYAQTGESTDTGKTNSGRKRKSPLQPDPMVCVVQNFCDNASNRLGDIAQRIGHDQDMSAARKMIYSLISKMSMLTLHEKLRATTLIARNAEDIDVFFSLPDPDRVEWVNMLLNGEI
ncbi:hypothetical protein ACS0TY_010099 [Phlomoides rotata]